MDPLSGPLDGPRAGNAFLVEAVFRPAWSIRLEDRLPRGLTHHALKFNGFPTASSPGHLIKRMVDMPGDIVACCDARAG